MRVEQTLQNSKKKQNKKIKKQNEQYTMPKNKDLDVKILAMIKEGVPYREIMKKHGLHSISKIARIKEEHLGKTAKKPKKKRKPITFNHRKKISITANAIAITNKSEIIVKNVIDILAGMRYSIVNLEGIQGEQKEKSENVVSELQELNKKVDQFLDASTEVSTEAGMIELQKKKDALSKRINLAIDEAGNFYARDTLRIKAIAELRNQFKAFVDLEIVAKGLTQVKEVLDTLFIAMQVLSDDTYVRFRNRAIEINPVVRGLFAKNEATVDEPDKPGETLDSDTNK